MKSINLCQLSNIKSVCIESGVDRQDKMFSYYPCKRRIQMVQEVGHTLFSLTFTKLLTTSSKGVWNKDVTVRLSPEDIRKYQKKLFIANHPAMRILNTGLGGRILRKRYRYCSQQNKRKETIHCCEL